MKCEQCSLSTLWAFVSAAIVFERDAPFFEAFFFWLFLICDHRKWYSVMAWNWLVIYIWELSWVSSFLKCFRLRHFSKYSFRFEYHRSVHHTKTTQNNCGHLFIMNRYSSISKHFEMLTFIVHCIFSLSTSINRMHCLCTWLWRCKRAWLEVISISNTISLHLYLKLLKMDINEKIIEKMWRENGKSFCSMSNRELSEMKMLMKITWKLTSPNCLLKWCQTDN